MYKLEGFTSPELEFESLENQKNGPAGLCSHLAGEAIHPQPRSLGVTCWAVPSFVSLHLPAI